MKEKKIEDLSVEMQNTVRKILEDISELDEKPKIFRATVLPDDEEQRIKNNLQPVKPFVAIFVLKPEDAAPELQSYVFSHVEDYRPEDSL